MSQNTEQDVVFIQALAQLLRESDLTELEVKREYGERDELKVRLSRASFVQAAPPYAPVPGNGRDPRPEALVERDAEPRSDEVLDDSNAVTSPMVGTAYLSPEPGAEAFVSVDQEVEKGETILIIEAMKTMNQIPSPVSGTVRAILVSNAEPVEYGAPLMVVA